MHLQRKQRVWQHPTHDRLMIQSVVHSTRFYPWYHISRCQKNVSKEKPESCVLHTLLCSFVGPEQNGPSGRPTGINSCYRITSNCTRKRLFELRLLAQWVCPFFRPCIWGLKERMPTVWHATNLNLRDRAMQLAFDVRKLQRSGREKLIPVERLEQKRQVEHQVDVILGTNGSIPDLQRRLFRTLTPQERVIYERVSQHSLWLFFSTHISLIIVGWKTKTHWSSRRSYSWCVTSQVMRRCL